MKEDFFVTYPIYYVNDVPHIGHAYTTMQQTFLRGVTGCLKAGLFPYSTDEHGQKVEGKLLAEKDGHPKSMPT